MPPQPAIMSPKPINHLHVCPGKYSYRRIITGLLFFLLSYTIHAQDIHFSQFFEAPLLRNPSLAGLFDGDVRLQLVYRDQWKSVTPNSFRTASFNGEYKMPVGGGDDYFTMGGQVLYDKAGSAVQSTIHLLPVVNYHKSISSVRTSYISLGFMGGWVQKRIDYTKMTTTNQYRDGSWDPGLPTGEYFSDPSIGYWDGSVGMNFNTSLGSNFQHLIFIGAAYHHINRPKTSFYKNAAIELHPKYVFSAGLKFSVDDYRYFTLQQEVLMQGASREIIGGGLYSYELDDFPDDPMYVVHAGVFVRWNDAIVPVVKMDVRSLSVTLSYDINTSPLKTASQLRGGFELGLSWKGFAKRNSSQDKVLCPRF
jgi:type IX secretion system PorP/SprF family membrane protein